MDPHSKEKKKFPLLFHLVVLRKIIESFFPSKWGYHLTQVSQDKREGFMDNKQITYILQGNNLHNVHINQKSRDNK